MAVHFDGGKQLPATALKPHPNKDHFKPEHAKGHAYGHANNPKHHRDTQVIQTSEYISVTTTSITINNDKAMKMLQQANMEKLNEIMEKHGITPEYQDSPDEFTPEKVSDRIISFVEVGLANAAANGADAEELNGLYEAAKSGIEKGFADAKEILEGLQAFNGLVEENFNATRDLVDSGMEELGKTYSTDAQLVETLVAEEPDIANAPVVTTGTESSPEIETSVETTFVDYTSVREVSDTAQSGPQSLRAGYSEAFNLTLTTAEGDVVNLSIYDQIDYREHTSASGEGATVSTSRLDSNQGFVLEVDGDLNDEETAAIHQLLEDVSKVADEFFSGDVLSAYENVQRIGFDVTQLESFELDLQQTTYARPGTLQSGGGLPMPVRDFGAFSQSFNEVLGQFDQQGVAQEPESFVVSILHNLIEQEEPYAQLTAERQQLTHQIIDIVGQLGKEYLDNLHAEEDDAADTPDVEDQALDS